MEPASAHTPQAEVARLREEVADLERQLEAARALAETGAELAGTLDFALAAERVVATVLRLVGGRSAQLCRFDPQARTVTCVAAVGEGDVGALLGRSVDANTTMGGHAFREGRAVWTPDVLAEPGFSLEASVRELIAREGSGALAAVPLRARGEVVGSLVLVDRTGRRYTDQELVLLSAFGDQVALALENSRSHAEVVRGQHEAEELARVARLVNETLDLTTVGERIAEGVLALLGVQSSAIRLFRPDGLLGAIALGGGAKEHAGTRDVVAAGIGLIGRAAVEGRPIWTEDIRTDARFELSPEIRERNAAIGIVAGLAVPLRVAGKVIGVLSVGSPTPRAFTEGEIGLLQTFADQAAIAINNAQAQDALAKQAERLRILHEIDRALIAEQAPAAIAEAVLRPLRELLGVPRAIVNIFDLAAGEVEWLAAAGRHRIRIGPGVRYSLRLMGNVEALKRGELQVIDVHALPPSAEVDALLASGVHVYMVVPMIAGGELIGALSFGGAPGPFPAEQVSIAQEAATQLAIAIAQARLHERVKRQAEELELRVQERTRELSAANDELGKEIGERRRAEAEADRANRAKSEFLSRMSHELRTPLNAILGFAQLLEMDAVSAEQKDSVGQILRGGHHLLGLINEVLEISRIEAGRLQMSLEPVPVYETLRQAIELVQPSATASRVSVRADAIDERLHVLADRQRLQQVLLNLLSNAIKYNRPSGMVIAACERVAENRLRIQVTDTGHGIAADKLERLFTPFDRLGAEAGSVEGTGLGLALSRSLVEAMGGTMHVQSQQGTGSTFSVELSVVAAPVVAADVPSAVVGPQADGDERRLPRKILYIEDNLSNLRLVERVLGRRPGITVLSAMQGRVGLDLARDHRPDLILLDRHLPDMSGDEVFLLLRDDPRTRDIPVIILSADATPGGARRLLDAGVRAYLTKPLDVHSLLAAVDENLRSRE